MGIENENIIDDTALEFPRAGFWAVHLIGGSLLFFLGMRYAVKRVPMPIIAYRLLRSLTRRW
ncbi:hypothetical protein [Acetonema longum]|uniref:Uncharacterized protein n=1 Tax=Acetonema longum DSM 6540 TaxID=1009370 RepID=F7NDG3_9FIRM|nr:hypothetical protein [Acetonema longum]EGO65916.1 hypothetical protein ALO_00350 [Acetonema longum DSM 6540]